MGRVTSRPPLRFTKRGAVATVVLDRPKVRNAYDVAMRDALYAALGAVDEDPEVRVLVLRGNGPAFCSGGDLREFGTAPSPVVARAVRWRRDVWTRLLELRAVTLAAVHGWTVGSGFEMALLCDVVLAATGTRFALPEVSRGLIPGVGGTQTLPRWIGLGRALDVVLAGHVLDARAAARLGVVHAVVPATRLPEEATRLARRLAHVEPAYARAVRRAVRAAGDVPLALGTSLERALTDALEGRG